jgi:predicted transglutaminase-like cysteine proteinase
MKNISLTLLVFLMTLGVFAQRPERTYDKEKLESARVAFITNRLDLKPEQAEKFWPAFNEYQEKRNAMMKDMSEINRKANSDISDQDARQLINKRLEIQQNMLNLEKQFMDDVQKTISPSQAAKLHEVNRQFTRQLYRMNQGRSRGQQRNN